MATDENNDQVHFLHCDECGEESLKVDCDGRSKSSKARIGICITPDCGNTKDLIRFKGYGKETIQAVSWMTPPPTVQELFKTINDEVSSCILSDISENKTNDNKYKIKASMLLPEFPKIDAEYSKEFMDDYTKFKEEYKIGLQENDRHDCTEEKEIGSSKETLEQVQQAAKSIPTTKSNSTQTVLVKESKPTDNEYFKENGCIVFNIKNLPFRLKIGTKETEFRFIEENDNICLQIKDVKKWEKEKSENKPK